MVVSTKDPTFINVLNGLLQHMQKYAERHAEYAQRREDRESKQEDQKMNFANQAAKCTQLMRPPTAKIFFGGKSITDVTMAELRNTWKE
jgi:hypothetical protein